MRYNELVPTKTGTEDSNDCSPSALGENLGTQEGVGKSG